MPLAGMVMRGQGPNLQQLVFDQGIGIIGFIGKKGLRVDRLEQWCDLTEIEELAGGKR